MSLEVKNINTIDDMQRFVEGCINDFEAGISTKEETLDHLRDYTLRIMELCKHGNHFPEDLDKVTIEAERQGFVFYNGEWRQSGFKSRSMSDMYAYIKTQL